MSEPGYCCGISRPHICCDCGGRDYCTCACDCDACQSEQARNKKEEDE